MKILNVPARHAAMVLAVLILSGCASPTVLMSKLSVKEEVAGSDIRPTAKTLYAMARLLSAQGKESECQFVLRRMIQDYPHFMPAYSELAEVYMRIDQVDRAVEVLAAGLEVSPNQPVLINNLGMCYLVKGDYERALQRFTEATQLVPLGTRYRANKAVALGMMGDYEASLSIFAQHLAPWEAHYNLAVLSEARHDFERATEEFALAEKLKTGRVTDELKASPDRTARLDPPEVMSLP